MLHGCTQITFKYLFLPFLLFLAFFVSFVIPLHRLRKWVTFTELNLDIEPCFSLITSYKAYLCILCFPMDCHSLLTVML